MTQKERALNKAKYVKGLRKLKLHSEVNSDWSVNDIIVELFMNPWRTFFADHGRKQTTGGARSITDVYRVVSFYHPEIKIHEVIDSILECKFKYHNQGAVVLYPYYCHTVCKCVFNKTTDTRHQSRHITTEFNLLSIHEILILFRAFNV